MFDNPFIVALLSFAVFSYFFSCLKSFLKSFLGDNHTISSDKSKVSLDKDTVSFNEKHNTRTQIYLNGEPYYLDD